jgi:chemotaxis protein MotB
LVMVLPVVATVLISCGPSRREHERTVAEVEALKEEISAKDARIEHLESQIRNLAAELSEKPEVIETVKVEKVKGTIRFTILNEVLFDKASSELQKEGKAALETLIQVIKEEYGDRSIVIEGHTDDQPYKEPQEFSNWDLSAERALAVLKFFEERGIPPKALSIAAYGQYQPVADNSTEEGRRKNRRAVVVVQPPESSVERARREAVETSAPAPVEAAE